MNGLALCAGIGGLELGLKLVLGDSYRTICYVEREAYPAACLVKKIQETFLDKAPVWDDVATFDGLPWRGLVDIVTSGFPCQPYSLAGKRQREKDPRHIWPDISRIIGECRPSLVFLENVHISAFREPFADLQAMGFSIAPPYICTAAEMGAGHIRRRVFVLAYRDCPKRRTAIVRARREGERENGKRQEAGRFSFDTSHISSDAASFQRKRETTGADGSRAEAEVSADMCGSGRQQELRGAHGNEETHERRTKKDGNELYSRDEEISGNASGQSKREQDNKKNPGPDCREARGEPLGSDWWASEPGLERLVHGVPNRVDRDRALGNAVVPVVAAKAFFELVRQISK